MITKKTSINSNIVRTILIIIGIIVAIILSTNSGYLLTENSSSIHPLQKLVNNNKDKKVIAPETHSDLLTNAYKIAGFVYGKLPSFKQ